MAGTEQMVAEWPLPATDEVISAVDVKQGVMTVHLIPGLLDDTETPAQDPAETNE